MGRGRRVSNTYFCSLLCPKTAIFSFKFKTKEKESGLGNKDKVTNQTKWKWNQCALSDCFGQIKMWQGCWWGEHIILFTSTTCPFWSHTDWIIL